MPDLRSTLKHVLAAPKTLNQKINKRLKKTRQPQKAYIAHYA
jgi:hypothetical protein